MLIFSLAPAFAAIAVVRPQKDGPEIVTECLLLVRSEMLFEDIFWRG